MVNLEHWDNDGDRLVLHWADGRRDALHAIWLRDNSPNAQARHANGQKLFDITDLSEAVTVEAVSNGERALHLRFAPDGHEAAFDLAWLHRHGARHRPVERRLWGAELAEAMPIHHHDAVRSDDAAKAAWLRDIRDLGFALLKGVPTEPGTLIGVAESFSYVRETNYGRYFEVRADPDPINLANTPMGLSCHTDNPYRDPVPGLQLLHCLVSENDGGESIVMDGYRAAELLRGESPDAFALLTRHAVPFRFASAGTDLVARARLITLDDQGEVAEIRFNNRSITTFDLPADIMGDFYAAYRGFAEILQRPDLEVGFKASPGDLFIVDNQRVLHGRKAVGGSGRRHLQGCYADKDSLMSTLRVLERTL